MVALWSLVAATTLAVAFYVTVWLVLPYLALMAFVLGIPLDRLRPRRAEPANEQTPVQAIDGESEADSNATVAPTASDDDGLAADPEPVAVKTRRGKGRARKPKVVAVPPVPAEPTAPNWVRVGPGKFVRADAATLSGTTPEPSPSVASGEEPAEDTGSAVVESSEMSTSEMVEPTDAGLAPAVVESPPARDKGTAPDALVDDSHDPVSVPDPVLISDPEPLAAVPDASPPDSIVKATVDPSSPVVASLDAAMIVGAASTRHSGFPSRVVVRRRDYALACLARPTRSGLGSTRAPAARRALSRSYRPRSPPSPRLSRRSRPTFGR